MSTQRVTRSSTLTARGKAYGKLVGRAIFGDRRGLALFLGALCFFALYWRIGVFITDTNAIGTTLVNVADGHLSISTAPYGSGLNAPGTYVANGKVFGRDYGIVFLALPVLWALRASATVLAPQVVVIALWSLLLLSFAATVGRLLDSDGLVVGGSGFAVVAFVANVSVATPIEQSLFPILALQIVTMAASAFTAVLLYRLVADLTSHRLGLMAGTATVIGTPVGFWASLPKRHSFTVLAVVIVMSGLYESRKSSEKVVPRALAYAAVGYMAWIHAAEALILVLPLVVIDAATAPSNDRRSVGFVAFVFVVSLLPFFLTNLLISGNPVKPPRMLPSYQPSAADLDMSGGDNISSVPVVGKVITIASAFGSLLWDGVLVTASEPVRYYRTFVRSGYLPGVAQKDGLEAINLTILESAPLVGGLLGLPIAIVASFRSRTTGVRRYLQSPAGATDAYVLACSTLFVLLYIPKLPLHAQVTVRYLHPLFPLAIYALIRIPAVHRTLDAHWKPALWTFAGTVFIGSQLVVAYLGLTNPGLGEALQFHALLAIATGGFLGSWTVAGSLSGRVPDRIGAVTLGLTSGLGTTFVLLSGVTYFDYAGAFALPVVGLVSDLLALV
ncbi:hypothetical protein ACFR9U_09370 [Halorientalis brevis]|uniref:Glycosyltransferase RgtA/B/C/D-like domain-containing protein n=1 Tax=Halorientalis brevis TaxID=1126241 RepID=A0ABD6CA39_9EURY|nr:hypothetical protein [Halorientalis brevis]